MSSFPTAFVYWLMASSSILLLLRSGIPVAAAAAAAEEDEVPCRLYMAPSYLSSADRTVFGLFAGQAFAKDTILPSAEVAIPIFDFMTSPAVQRSDYHRAVADALESSMWVSEYTGSKFEANHSTSAFLPGIGVLPQYHSGYANIDWHQASLLTRQPDDWQHTVAGQPHPSRGAITPYYNATIRAVKDIPQGMELFVHFGEDPEPDMYHERISYQDYETADAVVQKIYDFYQAHGSSLNGDMSQKVLDFMLDTILQGAAGKHATVVRSLIPAQPSKVGVLHHDYGGSTFLYRHQDMIRDDAWLATHGLCVDNLVAGPSTIPAAGRGALARRPVPRDTVISPVPMIPILADDVLDVYDTNDDNDDGYPVTRHLLVNYCYGHVESNLLLLPSAPLVNLVNHAPTPDQVNAFLMWSKHDDGVFNDHDLHDRPLSRWRPEDAPIITMVLVATRDIEPGEEILIDYGAAWARDYATYYESYETAGLESWARHAVDVRPAYTTQPYPVGIQAGQVPYPPGVVTACFIPTTDDPPDGSPRTTADTGLRIMRYVTPPTTTTTMPMDLMGQNLGVCDLTDRQERDDGTFEYTVVTRLNQDERVQVRHVPHAAITLVDRPYTSDMHVQGAFRRAMDLNDQRFPQAWRNRRDGSGGTVEDE